MIIKNVLPYKGNLGISLFYLGGGVLKQILDKVQGVQDLGFKG